MLAVIELGGNQFIVREGDVIDVKKVSVIMRHKATSIGRVRVNGKQHRVWSIDNKQYTKKEATELYEKYLSQQDKEDFSGIDV